jgi:hypothetical protein
MKLISSTNISRNTGQLLNFFLKFKLSYTCWSSLKIISKNKFEITELRSPL